MSNVQINTSNHISINDQRTGLAVVQSGHGTTVYTIESSISGTKYKEHAMPHDRYSLSTDKPASGNAGRSDFDRDILVLIKSPDFTL